MYGGRVIDDFDRRIVQIYLNDYMGDFLFDIYQPFHFYRNENVNYIIPPEAITRDEFIGKTKTKKVNMTGNNNDKMYIFKASIDQLPLANSPEVFGLHANAEIGYYTLAVKDIWSRLIEIQPQVGKFVSVFMCLSVLN